jgi:hypothetical protein
LGDRVINHIADLSVISGGDGWILLRYGLGAEVVVVSGVGELGASGRGDQGQVRRVGYDFYLHFGPFGPMIFYFLHPQLNASTYLKY